MPNVCNQKSFTVSTNLIDTFNPNVIEFDSEGEYVYLDLVYKTIEEQYHTLRVCFEVVETNGHDFVLGNDVLQKYFYDTQGIVFEFGEVRIYKRE